MKREGAKGTYPATADDHLISSRDGGQATEGEPKDFTATLVAIPGAAS